MTILARFVLRNSRKIAAVWAVLTVIGAALAVQLNGRVQNGGFNVPGSQSAQAVAIGKHNFGDKSQAQAYFSVISPVASVEALLHDVGLVESALKGVPGVTKIGTPNISHNHTAVVVPINLYGDLGRAQAEMPALEVALSRISVKPAKATLIGQVPVAERYVLIAKNSLKTSASVSFPITLLILLVAFLSVIAAGLPMLLAGVCLSVTFGGLYLLTYVLQLNAFVEDTVPILGLALCIDFSLFIVVRVRECLADGMSSDDAITKTLCTTGRAILVSGLTVATSLAGLFILGLGFLNSLAIGSMIAALLAALTALTLTPALIVILGDRLNRYSLRVAVRAAHRRTYWRGLSAFVLRRRWVIVGVLVPLFVLASLPVRNLHVTFKTFSILPHSDPVRRATIDVEHAFGPGYGAPIVVYAKTSSQHLEKVLERQPGIAQLGVPEHGSQGWRRITAVLRAVPDSNAAEELVAKLRPALGQTLGSATVIGGPTAEALDLAERINARTLLVLLAILAAEALFLTLAFQAPIMALKAAVSTLLSVTAALGILALLFGGANHLAYFVPLMLIAIVFGLSADYEVFLLSRVRENYRGGASNAESIGTALVASARSITLAGVTMSVVFFALATSPLAPLQQLGVGLGLAILLDVTVVRALLVPAAMAVLGDLNWWRPGWTMQRRLAEGAETTST